MVDTKINFDCIIIIIICFLFSTDSKLVITRYVR